MPFDNPLPRPIPEGHRRMEDLGFASPQAAPSVDDDVLLNLIAAKAWIVEKGWWQPRVYRDGQHSQCASNALVRTHPLERALTPAHLYVARALPVPSESACAIMEYNDLPTTTKADVLSLFDRAIAARRNEIGA